MKRFLLGFITGIAAAAGLLVIENYLENASLRDEGQNRMTFGEATYTGPGTWTKIGNRVEMAATT